MNLWNPSGHLSLWMVLLTALLLGMIHGVTPDEHTWPITFSYSVGSYSTRGGMKAGFLFSFAFMLQRAIAAEIAFLAVGKVLALAKAEGFIYVAVGFLMMVSGAYILRMGNHLHYFQWIEKWIGRWFGGRNGADAKEDDTTPTLRKTPARMALVHGFVAGWGTGAFAIIVYTVLVPQMPSAYVAFIPGLLFGVGTMIMQVLLGAFIGFAFSKLRVKKESIPYIGRKVSGHVLFSGGIVFLLAGVLGFVLPVNSWQWSTGIHVHNLDTIGIGFVLSVVVLFTIASVSIVRTLREVRTRG